MHFDRLIDTRERDLVDEPPATLAALEAYAEGTSATLLYLALEALGASEPPARAAARDIGIGYALAGLLRAMPFHARAGRRYIPADAGARFGLDPADYAGLRDSAGVRAATAAIADAAAGHLRAARRHRRRDCPIGPCRLVARRGGRAVSRAAPEGRLQPVRAGAGHPRPAAELAAARRRPARPVLDVT